MTLLSRKTIAFGGGVGERLLLSPLHYYPDLSLPPFNINISPLMPYKKFHILHI